jgi:hypothetical protein
MRAVDLDRGILRALKGAPGELRLRLTKDLHGRRSRRCGPSSRSAANSAGAIACAERPALPGFRHLGSLIGVSQDLSFKYGREP